MSGYIKTRSRTKGNETTRGDASAAPDNPGISGLREERGHEARALSNNTTTMQMLASSSFHCSMELGQNQYGSASLEQPGSIPASSERPGNGRMTPNEARAMPTTASSTFDDYGAGNGPNISGMSSNIPTTSEWPGSVQTTSNEARTMQTAASSTFDDYRAENGPGPLRTSSSVPGTSNDTRTAQRIALLSLFSDTSSMFDDYRTGNGPGALGTLSGVLAMLNDTGMVQIIAPSSLFSKDNAVPTGSGTATFQNVETMRTFALSLSIGYDEPGRVEDGPTPSFYPSSPAGTHPRGMGGVVNLPAHETDQGLEGKGQATSLWPSSHYDLRVDLGDATTASQESNGSSQTAA